jgi:hypothetical protein
MPTTTVFQSITNYHCQLFINPTLCNYLNRVTTKFSSRQFTVIQMLKELFSARMITVNIEPVCLEPPLFCNSASVLYTQFSSQSLPLNTNNFCHPLTARGKVASPFKKEKRDNVISYKIIDVFVKMDIYIYIYTHTHVYVWLSN